MYGQYPNPWDETTGSFRYPDLTNVIFRKDGNTASRQLPADNSMVVGMIVHSGDLVALGAAMKSLRKPRAEHRRSCWYWMQTLKELPKEKRIWDFGRHEHADGILGSSLGPFTRMSS
jgi:hypothetical protein